MVEQLADKVVIGGLCGVDVYVEVAKIILYILSKNIYVEYSVQLIKA